MHCNLGESCREVVNGSLSFVLLLVTDTKDMVKWGDTPQLTCSKVGKDELGQDLAKAIIGGEVYKFFVLSGIKRSDMVSPEGNTGNCGVEDIKCSFVDGAFCGVVISKWDGKAIDVSTIL